MNNISYRNLFYGGWGFYFLLPTGVKHGFSFERDMEGADIIHYYYNDKILFKGDYCHGIYNEILYKKTGQLENNNTYCDPLYDKNEFDSTKYKYHIHKYYKENN